MKGIPEQIAQKIREIGNVFNPDVVKDVYKLYLPILRQISNDHIIVKKDIPYGQNERHLLDIHYLKKKSSFKPHPIVYLHGGGFTRGHKNALPDEPELIHGNIANFFTNNGFIGINATYRLAPENTWPSGAEDIAKIVSFLLENGNKLGLSTDKIFLFGQSAGASHVASYLFDNNVHNNNINNISAAILFSGAYDLSIINSDAVKEYYGDNKDLYEKRSSINYITRECCPLFIVNSEFDPPVFKLQGERLVSKLKDKGHFPMYKNLVGHNHLSQVIHLNTDDDSIGPELIKFLNNLV